MSQTSGSARIDDDEHSLANEGTEEELVQKAEESDTDANNHDGTEEYDQEEKKDSKQESTAAGLVGALDHVLKKTFKDFYDDSTDENSTTEEKLHDEASESILAETIGANDQDNLSEEADKDDEDAKGNTESNANNEDATSEDGEETKLNSEDDEGPEGKNQADAIEGQETNRSKHSVSEGRDAAAQSSSQNPSKDALGFDLEDLESIPVEAVHAEIQEIDERLQDELAKANALEAYLEEERQKAIGEDERAAQEIYDQGLLIGAEYPLGPSSYAVSNEKLRAFGGLSAHLINVNNLLASSEENEQYKRGQVTRGEEKACKIRPSTPNYLMPKERHKVAELQAAKQKAKAEAEASGNQESDEQEQKSKGKESKKMSSEAMRSNLELLARMKKQISFLKNPRFTLTTRATRDWRTSLLNKDMTEPPTFAAEDVEELEQSWDIGFLNEPGTSPRPEIDEDPQQRPSTHSESTRRAPGTLKDRQSKVVTLTVPGNEILNKTLASKKTKSLAFSFNVEPGFAFFTNYNVNEPMECILKVVNVAPVSRGLRFLPPTSKFFSIVSTDFPSGAAVVAPGMACLLRISFCSDSLADYRDFVTVCTETEKFRIALVARRTPPKLTLARVLNAGSCFVGKNLKREFTFRNQGGPARFHLVSEEEWAAGQTDPLNDGKDNLELQNGLFNVLPRRFSLDSGDEAKIEVSFSPDEAGLMSANLVMVCDNCQVQLVTIQAASCQVKVQISKVGDISLDANRPIVAPPQALNLGLITVGGSTTYTLSYTNPTPIALDYHWAIRDARARAMPEFSILPKSGVLQSLQEQKFTVTFAPGVASRPKHYRAIAQLIIDNIPPAAVEGISARQLKRMSTTKNRGEDDDGLRSVPCCRMILAGESKSPIVSFTPTNLVQMTLPMAADTEQQFSTDVHNPGETLITLRWTNLAMEDGLTVLIPGRKELQIAPKSTATATFRFTPRTVGTFSHQIFCELNGEPSKCALHVKGEVLGPRVVLETREIDFGLLGVTKSSDASLVLRNLSKYASAHICMREMDTISTQDETKSQIKILNGAQITLAPNEVRQVDVSCLAGTLPERMRKILCMQVKHSAALYINVRAEIQSPKVFLRVSDTHNRCKIDLGTTYVTVPVVRTVQLVNLSNLCAPFRWVEVSSESNPKVPDDVFGEEESLTSRPYDVTFSSPKGVLEPKEVRTIEMTFNARKPGRVGTIFACEVEGMSVPLGFTLHSLVRGLVVAYSLVEDNVTAESMYPERPDSRGEEGGKASSSAQAGLSSDAANQNSSKLPVLDFGNGIELCKRKRLRLCIANHSAITTNYEIVVKAYGAKSVPRSLLHSRAGLGLKLKEPLTVAKLSSQHEEWQVYASHGGKQYIEDKIQAQEDRDVLAAGRGIAFLALPSSGVLKPWQAIIVDLYCFNNMPGRYRSELHCMINGLNPSVTPIKVGVIGSPLCLAANTVGLVKQNGETRLHFGHPLVGTEAVHKVIKITNNGPVAASVGWRVVAKREDNADLLETTFIFDEDGMSADENQRVKIKLKPHSDLSKAPPFVVEPHEQVIKPYGNGSFRVSFFPHETEENEDAAVIIADCDWADDSSGPVNEDGTVVSQITLESIATELLTVGSSATDARGESRLSTASRSISSAPAGATSRTPLRGFEKVHLAAHSAKPSLHLDRTLRGANARAFLGFVAWSTRSIDHRSFFKTLTFTNSSPTTMSCVVRSEPPFFLHDVKATSATPVTLTGKDLARLEENVPPDAFAVGRKAGLPPGTTLALTIRFQPGQLVDKKAHDPNDVLRMTYKRVLDIYFHNGDHQAVDLEGTMVAPAVLLAPALFDFGDIHVETSARTVLYMANPTVVPAHWRVIHVPKTEGDAIDDPTCWSFDIEQGTLAGPTLPLSSAQAFMPQGFDSNGKRVPVSIHVCFSPSIQGFHESKFRFSVQNGLDFDVVLRGAGSYEEQHDYSVRRLPAPAY